MSEEEPIDRTPLPEIKEEHLKDHAAIFLVEAAAMHAKAREGCATGEEIIDLLTRSMQEAFHNGYRIASHARGQLTPEQDRDIAEAMYSVILTIGSAALALAPLYEGCVAQSKRRHIITLN